MSIAELAAIVQTSGAESQRANPPAAEILVLALASLVLGFAIVMLIRGCPRKSPKP